MSIFKMPLLAGFLWVAVMATSAGAEDVPLYYPAADHAADIQEVSQPFAAPGYPPSEADGPETPAWLGSDAGLTDQVLAPFSDVQVTTNSGAVTVHVWGRSYHFDNSGFLQQVISQGTPLLASPIAMSIRIDGQSVTYHPTSLSVVEQTPTHATIEGLQQVGAAMIAVRTRVGFDGFIWHEVSVTGPAGSVVESCQLRIAMRPEVATLYNHADLGVVPLSKGNNTILLANEADGNVVPAEGLTLPFSWQITLLNETVGLQWFCESCQGWSPADPMQVIRITPGAGSVDLTVAMIENPKSIGDGLHLDFGYQALPVRPQADWNRERELRAHQWASSAHALETMNGPGVPLDSVGWVDGMTITPDRLQNAIDHGLKYAVIHQEWTELQGYPGSFITQKQNQLRRAVRDLHDAGVKVILYIGAEYSMAAPDWERFGRQIVRIPLRKGRSRTDPPAESYRAYANPILNDFLAHNVRELIREYQIDGLFLDMVADVTVDMNPYHGQGYADAAGNWYGTANVRSNRELLRRLRMVFQEEGREGVLLAHAGVHAPGVNFADARLAGEAEVYRKRIHPELSLAEVLSPNRFRALYDADVYGVPIYWMSKPDKDGFADDANLSITLLHRVMPRSLWLVFRPEAAQKGEDNYFLRQASYGPRVWAIYRNYNVGSATWRPYWANANVVTIMPGRVLVSLYNHHGADVLAIISNPTQEPIETTVQFNLLALGFDPQRQLIAMDAMTSEPFVFDGSDSFTLSVEPEHCRLVWIQQPDADLP